MSNKEQTAVDWLFKQLWDEPKDKFTWYAILKQAKEIHKEEIMNAYKIGKYESDKIVMSDSHYAKQYYEEVCGGNNEQ